MTSSAPHVDQVIAALDGLSQDHFQANPGARQRIIDATRRMLARLETPFEHMWHLANVAATIIAACRVIRDVGLWDAWREAGGKEASLVELHDLCRKSCDVEMLRRMLRLCTSAHLVEEVAEDRYGSTPTSLALGVAGGSVDELINGAVQHIIPSTSNLPDYLARHDYEMPQDPKDTPYMDISPGRKGLFDRWADDPALQKSFIGMMVGFSDMRMDWTDIYDTSQLIKDFDFEDDDSTLFVDVGGAEGVDSKRLLNKQPQIPPGRVVLQDLPDVVAAAKPGDKIRRMAHDFFKPQPVIGARAYFLHSVLHDWEDIEARRILKNVARAMKPGYSRLLVCEVALPATGASIYQAAQDVSLLHLLSARERSEAGWINLLRGADFQLVKIWKYKHSPDCVIEATLLHGSG